MGVTIYLLTFALLLVGIYAVVAKKNVIKIIVGVLVIDYAVNMLLVLVGYRAPAGKPGALGTAPILAGDQTPGDLAATAVDPLPQAMVLTSIVIGLGITALMVALALRLYEKYHTFDMNDIRRLRG
jgi:multicomponent Na+:H+ antiporter subunit C